MLLLKNNINKAVVIRVPDKIDIDVIREGVAKLKFKDCTPSQEKTWGFTPPSDQHEPDALVSEVSGIVLLTIREDIKIPKKSAVARLSREKIKQDEKDKNRKLNKNERESIRDAVKASMYPHTPTKETIRQIIYWPEKNSLIVIENNISLVQTLVEKFNRAIGGQSSKVSFIASELSSELSDTLTAWAFRPETLPKQHGFDMGKTMLLSSESSRASLFEQDCDSEEVRVHLTNNKHVKTIALEWNGEVDFMLSDKRTLSNIKMKKYLKESEKTAQEESQGDLWAYDNASFIIKVNAFWELWEAVSEIPTEL